MTAGQPKFNQSGTGGGGGGLQPGLSWRQKLTDQGGEINSCCSGRRLLEAFSFTGYKCTQKNRILSDRMAAVTGHEAINHLKMSPMMSANRCVCGRTPVSHYKGCPDMNIPTLIRLICHNSVLRTLIQEDLSARAGG